jgi:NAD(P)-dependent dehydrogenase (short-subunit alcohol dehydrogenase family)
VTISSSTSTRVNDAVKRLKSSYTGAKVSGYACDLSKPTLEQDIEALFKQVGKVDHIVFTAGDALAIIPIHQITLEAIHRAGQLRFAAPLLVAKIGCKYLPKSSDSSIVFTTAIIAEHPIPNWPVVAGYAAALHGATKNLALDLKPIRVNAVCPGPVVTELWKDMPEVDRDAMYKSWAEKYPTGHAALPEEVAEAYLWLMKDTNVTGRVAASDSGSLLI